MKVLIPTYIISLSFSSGVTSAQMYYHSSLFLISFIDIVLLKIVIPMINIYFIITISNNFKRGHAFKIVGITIWWRKVDIKNSLAIVIGLNATQGLISPVADALKKWFNKNSRSNTRSWWYFKWCCGECKGWRFIKTPLV